MNEPVHFGVGGRDIEPTPYQYTECGLDDVYLLNGFALEEYEGEVFVSVADVDGLWKAIALDLVTRPRALAAKEIRFLRHHAKLTQGELARLLRVSDQTVARWEKGQSEIPGTAEIVVRCLILSSAFTQPEGKTILQGFFENLERTTEKSGTASLLSTYRREAGRWAGSPRPIAA